MGGEEVNEGLLGESETKENFELKRRVWNEMIWGFVIILGQFVFDLRFEAVGLECFWVGKI